MATQEPAGKPADQLPADDQSPWQRGWNAGFDYARDGTMREDSNPYPVGSVSATEWDSGYSQGLDDSIAGTWLAGPAS